MRPTHIVGIGASAGGLPALEAFLAAVPPHSGLAFVVVQHLDPTRKAMLVDLLQRRTVMPVREVRESMPVDANAVHVIAPNVALTIADGVLHLAPPTEPRGQRLPIDTLFASLARDQGNRAVAVVLSGMGSDGTLGLEAIKASGGLTLAQQPESSEFPAMPSHAIAAGCVDVVAPPGELPALLLQALAGGRPGADTQGAEPASSQPLDGGITQEDALDRIIARIREHNGHDLAQYKTSTLIRRIGRRMAVHGLPTMAAYADLLATGGQGELDLLYNELLIGVTSFFRDAPVWAELRDVVLPELLLGRSVERLQLRAWVVGCSTGEEAYSLAMTFRDVLAARPGLAPFELQVFATDVSADAIAFARRGQFPARIDKEVDAERLARYFTAHAGGYRINRDIRDMVLFARHDVTADPPFTRLDLLSCRNLLIYFAAPLQRRVLPLFHYCLLPGGMLLLGSAETVDPVQGLFAPYQARSRVFRRSSAGADLRGLEFPVFSRSPTRLTTQEPRVPQSPVHPANLQSLADQLLLSQYSPPAVLVNEAGDILYVSGRTGRYLEPAAGRANWNIHVMLRPGLRAQIAAAMRTSVETRQPVELQGLSIDDDGGARVDVVVRAVQEPSSLSGTLLVVFRDAPSKSRARRRSAGAVDTHASDELMRSRDEIQALRREMRASQEELKAANEELQSTNEELQSANEELTTAQEEAQSMNEELRTINNELQTKLDDLALAQSDMQNLLNSTNIATLFLDGELRVRRFTDQVARVIHLREGDVGRPLSDLATTLVYPQLQAQAREVMQTLVHCEQEIATTDGAWYAVRIMPYRTLTNRINGVVITFVDITVAKTLEARLRTHGTEQGSGP